MIPLLILCLLAAGCGTTKDKDCNFGVFDCADKDGWRIECPNYIPDDWNEYAKTARKWKDACK